MRHRMIVLVLSLLALTTFSHAAAKQIIILSAANDGTSIQVSYVLWITTSSPVPVAGNGSVWKGASAAENAAIIAGTTIELQRTAGFAIGTTKAAIQAALQTIWTQMQNITTVQPNGCFYDGTTWSC